MECKKERFFSFEYPSSRPRDHRHQEELIDAEMKKRGWKRLSPYEGWSKKMTIQCDKGHTWTTLVQNFKNECGCPRCCGIVSGERKTEEGRRNLSDIFAKRGWELLSEYTSDGEIQIRCEHGKVFTMKRRSAIKTHAQCDCVRINSLGFGKQRLLDLLATKGWELASDYTGFFEYVTIKCRHGKNFRRLPGNLKQKSRCDCDRVASSGLKGVYKHPNGRWLAKIQLVGTGKQKCIGTYETKEQAAAAREAYLKQNL